MFPSSIKKKFNAIKPNNECLNKTLPNGLLNAEYFLTFNEQKQNHFLKILICRFFKE